MTSFITRTIASYNRDPCTKLIFVSERPSGKLFITTLVKSCSKIALLTQDCDGDGQVDCQDYARIHKMGANGCVKEPDDSIRQFKRNLDTCLEEINASVLSVPQ